MVHKYVNWLLLLPVVALLACAPIEEETGLEVQTAIAVVHPTEGSQVTGTVMLELLEDGVKFTLDISGLTPGEHGFHIHEYGNCSAVDATSAGGHYNPTGVKHGGPQDVERHVGDFGNITADPDGVVQASWVDANVQLNGAKSVIGRAIVIHAGRDDLVSQPSGAAGARVACGVIGIDE